VTNKYENMETWSLLQSVKYRQTYTLCA